MFRSGILTGATFVFCLLTSPKVFAGSTSVVISQVYGGGGAVGAQYRNDFIELHNVGGTTVSLAGWTVQYLDINSNLWQETFLGGFSSIGPGEYFLIQEAAGAGGSLDLPLPINAQSTINLNANSGKVALVSNGSLLSGSCPAGSQIIDLVGYGSANCSEGSAAPPGGSTTAIIRTDNGCSDTDNNAADFSAGAPNPRNSASPSNLCQPASPVFVSWTRTATGTFAFEFIANSARSNSVQFSSNLISWAPLTAIVTHAGNLYSGVDTNASRSRFYRVVSQ
jgi:hypothetical protein